MGRAVAPVDPHLVDRVWVLRGADVRVLERGDRTAEADPSVVETVGREVVGMVPVWTYTDMFSVVEAVDGVH
ncbi:MAG: hypothetical protein ACLP7Q_06855 [Isosphaeraceae bacterium]